MKKLLGILLLMLCSCSPYYKSINVYNKQYPKSDKDLAEKEIFIQIKKYGGDSISLDKWITNKTHFTYAETIEKVYAKKLDAETYYVYRLIRNKQDDSLFYAVIVNCNTKNKKIVRKYKKELGKEAIK